MAGPLAGRSPTRTLIPGREINLGHYSVTVYPVGVNQAGRLFEHVIGRMQLAATYVRKPEEGEEEHAQRIVGSLATYAVQHAVDLIAECCVLSKKGASFADVPHYDLPAIARAWIEESFGEEKKWRPWLALVEEVLARLNVGGQGSKPISITEIWSSALSRRASASGTSSSADGPGSPTAA